MKKLNEIEDFGSVDADNDDLLLESFEDHDAYKSILDREKYLIIGRKGSGKTAIYKKLLTRSSHDFFPWGHTFSDYPWHHHDLQAREGIPDFDKFTHSWKYLILMTASKIILNQDHSLPIDELGLEEMSRIERFVLDSYGTRDPDVTQIFSPSKRLKIKPYFEIDWKLLKAGIKPESVPVSELPVIVSELNQNLSHSVIECLNPEHEYFIAFDQLDLGFNPDEPDYTNRLIGLLLAAKDINQLAKSNSKKLHITIFLRDDIFDTLKFEDKNKISENFLAMIEWDTPRTRNTLKSLMEKRFTSRLRDGDETIFWDSVFDETKEMTGHQTKYQHILDRTFLRPRDVIRFCNGVLREYKNRIQNEPDSESVFINQDVSDARVLYSDYFKNELDDEIHKHLPDYMALLEVIRTIGTWHFDKTQYEKQLRARYDERHRIEDALDSLFEFSILGFYRSGGRGYGGSEYVFRYKEPVAKFDPTATRFRIHPGLIEYLGLKRT